MKLFIAFNNAKVIVRRSDIYRSWWERSGAGFKRLYVHCLLWDIGGACWFLSRGQITKSYFMLNKGVWAFNLMIVGFLNLIRFNMFCHFGIVKRIYWKRVTLKVRRYRRYYNNSRWKWWEQRKCIWMEGGVWQN